MRLLGSMILLGLLSKATPVHPPQMEAPRLVAEWNQASTGGCALAFSPDGKRIAVQYGYEFYLWDVERGELLRRLPGSRRAPCGTFIDPLSGIHYSPRGAYMAAGVAESVLVWDGVTGALQARFRPSGEAPWVYNLAFRGERELWIAGSGTLHAWELTGPREKKRIQCGDWNLERICLPASKEWVACGGFGQPPLVVLDPRTGRRIRELRGPNRWVDSLTLTPDGSLLVAGGDGQIVVWDTHRWEIVHVIDRFRLMGQTLAITPDGRHIATGSEAGLVVWNLDNGRAVLIWPSMSKGGVMSLAFSPCGRLLAQSGYDRKTRIWDIGSL